MNEFFNSVKNKSKEIFIINCLVFIPMWVVFLLNDYLFSNYFNSWGITPRDLSLFSLLSIMSSWLLHGNYAHIIGNTTVLFPLLFMVCLLEKNPIKHLALLIFLSGLFTWLLGQPYSIHIGASGLVFALFGYILSSLMIGKNFLYLLPVCVVGYFYSQSIINGLIPQGEISFAAHFGGMVGGIILGAIIHKKEQTSRTIYKTTLKDKWNNLVWEIKYKFRKK